MPVVVTTQTLPVFAIAPILVIWFGFGIGSKIVMASLIIFFPVASSFYDGLKQTSRTRLDLGRSWGASRSQLLRFMRIPAAMPSLMSGLKVAATIAPIGAIVGEWAGAAGGLGFVMLQANARTQTDVYLPRSFCLPCAPSGYAALLSILLTAPCGGRSIHPEISNPMETLPMIRPFLFHYQPCCWTFNRICGSCRRQADCPA